MPSTTPPKSNAPVTSGNNSNKTQLSSIKYESQTFGLGSGATTVQWPKNLITEYLDHVSITAYRYVSLGEYYTTSGTKTTPTQSSSGSSTPVGGNSGSTNTASTETPTNSFFQNPTAQQRFLKNPGDVIKLPIPEGLQYADTPSWDAESLGVIGKQVPGLVKNFTEGDMNNATKATQALAEGLKAEIVMGAIEKSGLISGAALTSQIGGKIINPYTELIFKGVGTRSFSFNWKLIPRNVQEQRDIFNIIKILRVNSMPSFSSALGEEEGTGLNDRWLTVPNIFEVKFLSGSTEMSYLPKIKPAALKGIQFNPMPDGTWATHYDNGQPAPVAYTLSLEFEELEIITADQIKEGGY